MTRFWLGLVILGLIGCGSDPAAGRVEDDAGGGTGGAMAGDAGAGGTGGTGTGGSGGPIKPGDAGGISGNDAGAGSGGAAVDAGGSGGAVGSGGAAGTGGAQGGAGGAAVEYRTCMAVNGWEPTSSQMCVNNAGDPLVKAGSANLACMTCFPTPFMLHDEECRRSSGSLCVKSCSECAPL